jgi:hypothetical protein
MKDLFIVILLFSCYFSSYSQTKDEYAIGYPDDYLVIDSIKKKYSSEDYKLLVYQTGYNDECISSIVVLCANKQTEYWCIMYENSSDTIYPYSYNVYSGGGLKNDSIFLYKGYRNTGIIKKEDISSELKFSSPTRIKELIFYTDNKISFYFEDNTNTSREYIPDKKREQYRIEWTEIIKKELSPIFEKYCVCK